MENKAFVDDGGTYKSSQINGKVSNGLGLDEKLAKDENLYSNTNKSVEYNGLKDVEVAVDEEDPWKVTSVSQNYTPWSELSQRQKILRVLSYFIKIALVIGCLYLFICSLDFLSSAFRLLGGEAAGKVFQQSDIMTNPVAGLMMGVLVTVLVQSSSTSTSIIVSMVGAQILSIKTAIPIVMGANVGTSVTNTIVAIGQISDKGEFRRAFAGATVHDMFNWLTVIVLLPIEIATGYLYYLTKAIVDSLPLETNEGADKDMLKVITKPFTDRIIQIDSKAITNIAQNVDSGNDEGHMIMKVCCDKITPFKCCNNELKLSTISNGRNYSSDQKQVICNQVKESCIPGDRDILKGCISDNVWKYGDQKEEVMVENLNCDIFSGNEMEVKCCGTRFDSMMGIGSPEQICANLSTCFTSSSHNFSINTCSRSFQNETVTKHYLGESFSCRDYTRSVAQFTCYKECDFLFKGMYPALDDKAIGGILLVISLLILCACLVAIVKLLHSLLQGPMALIIKNFINADFPGYCAYFTGYLAILVGAGMTIIVQSSSIFTSTLTPLVGIGVIELDRMYPLTLGSNIGTTTTAILSALASSSKEQMKDPLQVAFCHLFFNITGILIFYPIPYFRFPIHLAKFLGNCTAKYRWYAIVYILLMFFVFPALVFALSVPGWYVLVAVLGPIVILIIVIGIIKALQAKALHVLPQKLQNWKFLPKPLRSLEPYDKGMQKLFFCKRFQNEEEAEPSVMVENSPSGKSNGSAATPAIETRL